VAAGVEEVEGAEADVLELELPPHPAISAVTLTTTRVSRMEILWWMWVARLSMPTACLQAAEKLLNASVRVRSGS
jgi:hypothetical protein